MGLEGGAVHTPGDLPASTSGNEHRVLQSRVCLRGHNQKVTGISGGRESRCSPPRSLQAEGARHPPNTSSRCRATASAMSSRQGRTAICRSITWTGTLVEQAITINDYVDRHACRINDYVDRHACRAGTITWTGTLSGSITWTGTLSITIDYAEDQRGQPRLWRAVAEDQRGQSRLWRTRGRWTGMRNYMQLQQHNNMDRHAYGGHRV